LAHEITSSIRTNTQPIRNPNLCASAFAEPNKFPNQGALPIRSFGVRQRYGQEKFIWIFCISEYGGITFLHNHRRYCLEIYCFVVPCGCIL